MSDRDIPAAVQQLALALAMVLRDHADVMTNEQRVVAMDAACLDWCRLCGGKAPCYCEPGYDE